MFLGDAEMIVPTRQEMGVNSYLRIDQSKKYISPCRHCELAPFHRLLFVNILVIAGHNRFYDSCFFVQDNMMHCLRPCWPYWISYIKRPLPHGTWFLTQPLVNSTAVTSVLATADLSAVVSVDTLASQLPSSLSSVLACPPNLSCPW